MIKAYGRLWKRELVDWRKSGLYGTFKYKAKNAQKEKTVETNCWSQRGIYVLYEGYEAVYVGQAGIGPTTNIGNRLKSHKKDDWQDRWDRFSWYGICSINANGTIRNPKANEQETPARIIDDLEAIAIFISDTENKKFGVLKAHKVEQKPYADAPVSELSDRTLLERIYERLEDKAIIVQK